MEDGEVCIMSKVETLICDKCGKELTAINNSQISQISARIDLYAVGKNRTAPSQRIDLCEDCYQKFINFLERSN